MSKYTHNGVTNYVGPRTSFDGVAGTAARGGDTREYVLFISGANLTDVTLALPAGATVTGNALAEVQEAFSLTGTSPVINIGVVGSEGTNRILQLSQAQAQAVGTYSIASAGTLAVNTPLAAAVTVGVALGGTTPAAAGIGKLKVSIPIRVI